MNLPLAHIPSRERRFALSAFLTLACLVASHAILETARDALFLASIPATRLPWLYIAIAATSVAATQLGTRLLGGSGARRLTLMLATAAVITLTLSGALQHAPIAGVYLLYVWTGVQTTVILLQLWTFLGGLFTVVQAKTVYGFVGTGSVVGAIAGSAVARAMTTYLPAEALIGVAGAVMGIAGLSSLLLWQVKTARPKPGTNVHDSLMDCARFVLEQCYARRLAMMVLLGTMTITVVDYLFKSTVAARIPAEDLGSFFATVYLSLNIGSLVVQVLLVGWIVKRFNLSGALAVLPGLAWVGGFAMLVLPGAALLTVALGMKAVDGVLRHTLHRTATELLFVPLTETARRRVKLFTDLGSQKGGQALTSVLLLGLAALELDALLPYLLAGLSTLWVMSMLSIRLPYLGLVRSQLRKSTQLMPLPELDMHSLESMVAALDSDVRQEVLVAMEMLEQENKANLVPTLILHHPDDAIVLHALQMFARTRRTQALPMVQRVAQKRADHVRAAAIRCKHELDEICSPDTMRTDCTTCAPAVRANRLASLVAQGHATDEERQTLLTLAKDGEQSVQESLAQDLRVYNGAPLTPLVAVLLDSPFIPIRRHTLETMDAKRFPDRRPMLVAALRDERTRKLAQTLIAQLDEIGESMVREGLDDATQAVDLRRHLAQAAALFEPQRAADLLQDQLAREEDGYLRYWIIRSLNRVKDRNPKVKLRRTQLEAQAKRTLGRAYRYLGRRVILDSVKGAARETRGFPFILRLLRDKERQSVGRVFLLLNLTQDREDFSNLWRSIRSEERNTSAAGLELLDNALSEPLRSALRGLVEDIPDADRLAYGHSYCPFRSRSYMAVLDELEASQSASIRELTQYHRREIVGVELEETLKAPQPFGEVARVG